MTARHETFALMMALGQRGIGLSFDEANTLRRAQITLQRWAELECGIDGGCIQRDEKTDIPYWYNSRVRFVDPHDPRAWHRIPDREAGALRRVKAICEAHGLHFYHQTDPRGCALYVDREPLPDNNYSRGIACCA